jgi:hypothetical protein
MLSRPPTDPRKYRGLAGPRKHASPRLHAFAAHGARGDTSGRGGAAKAWHPSSPSKARFQTGPGKTCSLSPEEEREEDRKAEAK